MRNRPLFAAAAGVLLLVGSMPAADPAAPADYEQALLKAAADYDARIRQAEADLVELRERLAKEKAPLLREVQAAEQQVISLQRDITRHEAMRDGAAEDRRRLTREQESIRKSINYLNTLAGDVVRGFHDGLAPGEDTLLGDQLQRLQVALDGATSAVTVRPAGDALDFLAGWTALAAGGYRAEGRAIDATTNEALPGTFVFLGPEVYFQPQNGGAPATVRRQTGSPLPFAYPLATWDRAGAQAFFSGRDGVVLADPTGGKALRLQETQGTLREHIQSGGWMAYVIIATGVLALLVIAQKFADLAGLKVDPAPRVAPLLEQIAAGPAADAAARIQGLQGATRELFATGLRHAEAPKPVLEEQLQLLLHRHQLQGERRLPMLAVIATAAPLMGLLGTVSGMVKTFALITVFGTGNAGKLSAGISEVLVATELGLMVAIPALIAHGFLSQRIRKRLSQLEHYAMELVIALESARASRPLVSAGGPRA